MRLCCGWGRTPLSLSPERRYYPEQLMGMLAPYLTPHPDSAAHHLIRPPVWISLDDQYVSLETEEELLLACRLASIYHNGPDCRAPPEDGWDEETAEMERAAAAFAEGGESDGSGSEEFIKVDTL